MKPTFIKSLDIGGKAINALEVLTEVPTKRWLLMYLGTGELGPADASQIGDLDNYGYQKYPSFETEFNIFAPQAVKSYSESDALIQEYMLKTYGRDIEIVMCGHSLGARNVMEFVNGYNGIKAVPQVIGFMPVAGEMSWPLPANWCDCADRPILAFHGRSDTAIGFVQSEKFVNSVNICMTRKYPAKVKIIDGLNHTSIMDYVFKPDREAEGYKFIMSCFTAEQKENTGRIVLLDDGTVQAIFEDGSTRTIEAH